ncbi:MAG: 50S ribosomal protein L11 methyltransferase [Beijerinckiaceae bacterium]
MADISLPWFGGVKGETRLEHDVSTRDEGAAAFIAANLPLQPAPGLPQILIHTATPASGLRRLVSGRNPYWAWCWAGGLALARHVLANPHVVSARRVLDLGAGSGLVGIAAARAGAREVVAVDVDEDAIVAIGLNAQANRVELSSRHDDLLDGAPPEVDVVLVGDLFYDRRVASRCTRFLDRCVAAGCEVYVGDPGRAFLPRDRLALIAEHAARDFGASGGGEQVASVFSFRRQTE